MSRSTSLGDDYRHLSPAELRRLAATVQTEGFPHGLAMLDGHPGRQAVLADLFHTGTSAWLHLVTDAIGERCLDVGAGFGTRSAMLADVASEVYAVESNPSTLRVLSARLGVDVGTNVTPVRGTVDRLPFSENSFDTVVVDAPAGSAHDARTLPERIATARRLLADDGTLLVTLDGWLRRSGLDALLRAEGLSGGDVSIVGIARALVRANANRYRRLFQRGGFESVELYALVPDRRAIDYAFGVDDTAAVRWYTERELQSGLKAVLTTGANRLGVLDGAYPGYLAVCGVDGSERSRTAATGDGQLLLARHARSVTFDVRGGELRRVTKTPNCTASAVGTARENDVLDALRGSDHPIVATLPSGAVGSSPFGPTRIEVPAEGTPLADRLGRDPASFRAGLDIGFEWLAAFQRAFGGDRVEKSPAEIRADLGCTHPDVGPPPIEESIESFVTPVHGDLSFENVLVEEGEVSCVLDWEFAARSGNPAADAGKLLCSLCGYAFEDFERGFEAVFERETPHAAAFRDVLGTYCARVGLAPMAIGAYLSLGYVRILNDRRYTPWTPSFVGKANLIQERFEAVRTRFEGLEARSRSEGE